MEKVGQKTWRGILVYLEWEGEAFHPVSYELLPAEKLWCTESNPVSDFSDLSV